MNAELLRHVPVFAHGLVYPAAFALAFIAASTYYFVSGQARMGKQHDQSDPALADGEPSLRRRVEQVLDMIRPAVQSDGGDLELVDVSEEGVVAVRFHGACVGCPSSTLTLQAGIERSLKEHIPGITAVEAVP